MHPGLVCTECSKHNLWFQQNQAMHWVEEVLAQGTVPLTQSHDIAQPPTLTTMLHHPASSHPSHQRQPVRHANQCSAHTAKPLNTV